MKATVFTQKATTEATSGHISESGWQTQTCHPVLDQFFVPIPAVRKEVRLLMRDVFKCEKRRLLKIPSLFVSQLVIQRLKSFHKLAMLTKTRGRQEDRAVDCAGR